jgi:hypothetical protein
MAKESYKAGEALNAVIRILSQLDEGARTRVLNSVSTFFGNYGATRAAIVVRRSTNCRGGASCTRTGFISRRKHCNAR